MPFLCSPLPVWLGPLLHNCPVQNRTLFNHALLLGQRWQLAAGRCRNRSASNEEAGWLLLQPFWFLLPLMAWLLLHSCSQRSVWPGKQTVWQCWSQCYSLWRNKVFFKQWDQLLSFLQLQIDTLATLACTCKYEQILELFFASGIIE